MYAFKNLFLPIFCLFHKSCLCIWAFQYLAPELAIIYKKFRFMLGKKGKRSLGTKGCNPESWKYLADGLQQMAHLKHYISFPKCIENYLRHYNKVFNIALMLSYLRTILPCKMLAYRPRIQHRAALQCKFRIYQPIHLFPLWQSSTLWEERAQEQQKQGMLKRERIIQNLLCYFNNQFFTVMMSGKNSNLSFFKESRLMMTTLFYPSPLKHVRCSTEMGK